MLWLAFGKDHLTRAMFLLCWPVFLPTQQRQHSPNVLRLAKPPQFFVKESFTEAKASTREEPKPYRSCAHRRSAAGPTMGDGFAGGGAVPPDLRPSQGAGERLSGLDPADLRSSVG